MSADNIPGPVNGAGARDGQYQWLTLDATAVHVDLSAWKGEYIELEWVPATGDEQVRFAFYADLATAIAATLDVTTDSGDQPAGTVDDGPARLHKYCPVKHRIVPRRAPVLKAIGSGANAGLFIVRHAEGSTDETGEVLP